MTVRFRSLAAVPLLATVGCGGAGARTPARWEAVVDTLGDTIVVHTLAGAVWPDTATLVPELSIGVLEGAEEEMFGQIRAIAVAPDGELFVLDSHVPTVRRFGSDGTYLGSFGREGGGPGEFKRPEAMAMLPDGRILVRDPGNARIAVYAPDGTALPSWRLPSGGGFHTSTPVFVDTAGFSYTPVLLSMKADVLDWTWGLARFGPDGTHTDTIPVPTWDFEEPTVIARKEGSSSSTSVPFSPQVSWTFSPHGHFVAGLSTDYRVDLFRKDGATLRIERAWTPVAVQAAEKAEQERRIIENFKESFGSWKWNGPAIPDTKPPFGAIMVDHDGRLWIQVAQPGDEWRTEAEARAEEERTGDPQLRFRERVVYDVFEPDGRYLGAVRTPDEFRSSPPPVIRGDLAWVVTRDDMDVQRVIRYRITHPSGVPSAR
jgi:sugar lactone lactonase YvrE